LLQLKHQSLSPIDWGVMRRIGNFFRELRRRRVLRIVALYIVGAWVVLQAAALAFPGLQIPESAIRYVWIGAIMGFPVALILGWRFDIIGGRIVRTNLDDAGESQALSRADYAILAALSLVVAVITYGMLSEILSEPTLPANQPLTADIDPKSIAVLPFTNMSGDEANEPFTIGIHDDVLTHISKIGDIKVISRTSVARLDPGLSIPDIGRLLGVATVLESGVQRIGNRVRINAQLIDTASDQHLWAETFDRELTTQHIFAIQSEIAAAITDKLQASLSPREVAKLKRMPTDNLQAYEMYLLGQQRMITRTRSALLEASDYFEKAVELDPQYALAYVGLADANLLLAGYGHLSLQEGLAKAESSLALALAIDEQLGAAYASVGLSRVRQGDSTGAETAFKRAIELDPNNATPYHWYGDLLINAMGQPEAAIPVLERARELDPLSPIINITLGEALEASGQFGEAMTLYRKAIEIEPDFPAAYYLIATHYRAVYGKMDEAVRWYHEELAIEPSRDLGVLGQTYLDLGDDEKAEYWIDRAIALHPQWYQSNAARVFLHRYRGEEAQALQRARRLLALYPGNNTSLVTFVTYGKYQEALETIAPGYPELACGVEPTISRNNLSQAINLSLALQETGERECADRLLDKILQQIQKMPRLGARGYGIADVEVYARQGKTQLALETLRQAIDEGYRWFWWAQGKGSPHMVSLHEEPEFNAMMQEIRADMSAQLEHVREMEANGELASVPQ
jgi:TolB-like protein/Tfp pilus assembly protein PilF